MQVHPGQDILTRSHFELGDDRRPEHGRCPAVPSLLRDPPGSVGRAPSVVPGGNRRPLVWGLRCRGGRFHQTETLTSVSAPCSGTVWTDDQVVPGTMPDAGLVEQWDPPPYAPGPALKEAATAFWANDCPAIGSDGDHPGDSPVERASPPLPGSGGHRWGSRRSKESTP